MSSPELQQFRDLMAAKGAAKEQVMMALGRAKLAESRGEDAAADWTIVEEQGIGGVEGQKMAAAQALADSTVLAHPDLFAALQIYRDKDARFPVLRDGAVTVLNGQEMLANQASLFRQAGMEDEATVVTMFELAYFARQQIGVRLDTEARMPSMGGKG